MSFYYSPNIVTDGLVFAVDAADRNSYTSGSTTWKDMAGGNNGTLVNGPTFDEANGGSLVFDGSNDLIVSGPSNNIGSSLSSATWSAWFKSSNTTNIGYISALKRLPLGTASSLFSIVLNREGSGTNVSSGHLLILTNDGTNFQFLTHNGGYNDGNWHNVVGVVTPNNRILYVDGQSVASDSNGGLANVTNNTEPITIGAFENAGSNFFLDGNISNVSFHNRALTAQEVSQNYNALKSRFGLT